MAWTDSATVKKHLVDVDRVVTEYRDVPVKIGSDGTGYLSHKGMVSGSVAVKKRSTLTPSTQTVTLNGENWSSLTYTNLVPGEVVVAANSGLATIYQLDSDYAIDFAGGKIRRIAGGTISDGATVTIYYQRYTLLMLDTDYTVSYTGGSISKVSGGGLNADTTVWVDYDLSSGSVVDDLIGDAIVEAEDKILARLKSAYSASSTDTGLKSGATELALAIVCRGMVARALSDGYPCAEGRSKNWMALANNYEQSAIVTLKPFVDTGAITAATKKANGSWGWV